MTIKEIAKLAGVSISTVSKIINDKADNINIETKNRVLRIVKEYHYEPYGSIIRNSSSKTFLIGVLLKKTSQLNLLLQGVLNACQRSGYSVLISDSNDDEAQELKLITSLCKNRVDGVIWEPVCQNSISHASLFAEQGIRIAYINSPYSENSFCIDFSRMGYLATQKLLEYHHTNIACLTRKDSFRSQMALEGFKKCLFDHRLPFTDDMVLLTDDKDSFTRMCIQKYTGIVSSHFEASLSLYETMCRLHYSIPFDLSLVSLREDGRKAICFPRISSIQIPYEAFGERVGAYLISQCESRQEAANYSFCMERMPFDHEESIYTPPSHRYKKIVVVGSINTDVTLSVDDLPAPGSTTVVSSSILTPGGKGANQAVGAAKLGRNVILIGKTGNDYDSGIIFDAFRKDCVNTQGISRDLNLPTGKAYISVQKDAESTITLLPGANASLSPQDISSKSHLFENAGFCLISTEIPQNTCIQAARTAREHGVQTIVKPATLKALPGELIQYTDIFVPNRKEAALLCPAQTVEEQAEFFFSSGISTVIITLGHKGCFLKTKEFQRYFPAASFPSTDSTGGADAFISALASYLTEGYSMKSSIQIASYAAGFCVSRAGVIPALIDKTSLETHIKLVEPGLLMNTGP